MAAYVRSFFGSFSNRHFRTIQMSGKEEPKQKMTNFIVALRLIKTNVYELQPSYNIQLPVAGQKAPGTMAYIIFFDITQSLDNRDLTYAQREAVDDEPSSVVWCSYGWKRRLDDFSDDPFEPRKNELGLRNGFLKQSMRLGARYVRWQDDLEQTYVHILKTCFEETQLPTPLPTQQLKRRQLHEKLNTVKGEEITDDEINESDIVIIVMGPTGAGKSTLIKTITGSDKVDIGDTLDSCTTEIGVTRVSVPGGGTTTNIVLVDTPGFEDTHKSDRFVFKMIAQWLEQTFIQQIPVSGVVYLHKISDNRMGGTALSNLGMFQKICGVDAFKRIVLTTTMWGEVESEQQGAERENQLVKNYWKAMMDKGARAMRFQGDRDSALGIIRPLIEEAADVRPLRLQAELTQLYKDLPETDAGRKMYSKLEALLKEQSEAMSKLQQELGKEWSPQERRQLEEQIADLSTRIKTVVVDMQYMKLPLSARFYRLLHRS